MERDYFYIVHLLSSEISTLEIDYNLKESNK
jgi:hypothetical protein